MEFDVMTIYSWDGIIVLSIIYIMGILICIFYYLWRRTKGELNRVLGVFKDTDD